MKHDELINHIIEIKSDIAEIKASMKPVAEQVIQSRADIGALKKESAYVKGALGLISFIFAAVKAKSYIP